MSGQLTLDGLNDPRFTDDAAAAYLRVLTPGWTDEERAEVRLWHGPHRGAVISRDGRHRYLLWHTWADGPPVGFCLLNPSTADHEQEDATTRRLREFARGWGSTGYYLVNMFALRATDPRVLSKDRDPVGRFNDRFIVYVAKLCPMFICAWGAHGTLQGRAADVETLLRTARPKTMRGPWAFGFTAGRQPMHPLYLPKGQLLVPMAL